MCKKSSLNPNRHYFILFIKTLQFCFLVPFSCHSYVFNTLELTFHNVRVKFPFLIWIPIILSHLRKWCPFPYWLTMSSLSDIYISYMWESFIGALHSIPLVLFFHSLWLTWCINWYDSNNDISNGILHFIFFFNLCILFWVIWE